MTTNRWDDLRELLAEEPGELAFRGICAQLDTWSGSDVAAAFEAAEECLATWPDRVRVAPWTWLCALQAGEAPPSWRLVRTIRNFPENRRHPPISLRSLGLRPEWAPIKRLELEDETDEDLRWLAENEAIWPHLNSVKGLFWQDDAAVGRAVQASPLLPRLRTLSLRVRGRPFPLESLAGARRLDRLGLEARSDEVRELLERSQLPNLMTLKVRRRFDLYREQPDVDGARRLGEVVGLERLRALELELFHEAETEALLAANHLTRLREVSLTDGLAPVHPPWPAPGPQLVKALHKRPFLALLRSLTISHISLGDEGIIQLCDVLRHTRVQRLELSRVALSDEGTFALASCNGLRRLRVLDLTGNRMGSLGAATLGGSPYLVDLSELTLAGIANHPNYYDDEPQPVGDLGVIALAGKTNFTDLRKLDLTATGLTPRGVAALAASRSLRSLRSLDLGHNALGTEGGVLLTRAHLLPGLRRLGLEACGIEDAAIQTLCGANLSQMRELVLGYNPLGLKAVQALASCPTLPRLLRLDLHDQSMGDDGLLALANSEGFRQLVALDVEQEVTNPRLAAFSDASAQAIAASRTFCRLDTFEAGEVDEYSGCVTAHAFSPEGLRTLCGPGLLRAAARWGLMASGPEAR